MERGHPVFSQHVYVDPGQTVELRPTIEEPGAGRLTLVEPPLVVPDVVEVDTASD